MIFLGGFRLLKFFLVLLGLFLVFLRVVLIAGLVYYGVWTYLCMYVSYICSRDLILGWKIMLVLSRKERSRGWG